MIRLSIPKCSQQSCCQPCTRTGGGEEGPHNGGSNGGDGQGLGGKRTGENIRDYKLENYVLSAGAGGQYFGIGSSANGGGGGGVLINFDGPQETELKRVNVDWSHGEGYGGGGTYYNAGDHFGRQGVVIVEVVKL